MIILTDEHPYMRQFKVHVALLGRTWRVKWRDFQSMKQDEDFARFSDAQAFAAGVREHARVVDLETLDCWDATFEDLTKFWAGMGGDAN